MGSRLKQGFFARDSAEVAEGLLGKMLIREDEGKVISGIITETEAYYGADDPASRVAQQGRTPLTEIMWRKPGKLFVYMVHGHWLLNIITRKEERPGAVLIRAIRPVKGKEEMKGRRDIDDESRLSDGPGKLTEALAIDKGFNGKLITDSKLSIKDSKREADCKRTGRIGVSQGQKLQLRFVAADIRPFNRTTAEDGYQPR